MKTRVTKSGKWTISGLTSDQFNAMREILITANDRCFREPEPDGEYYSGDDFVCVLNKEEREALRQVCESL